jgi:hypothetical protein
MRNAFHQQLDALTRSIGDMCGLAGTAMQQATQALLDADIVLAETVISDHQNRVIQAAQTESDAFTLLALQAPVAADTPCAPFPTMSPTTSLIWAESPSISARTPKTLSCQEIPTKQPNSTTKTTQWMNYTATYSPWLWTTSGPTPSPPPST